MRILTTTWGELEIGDEQIYKFPRGMPGFEQEVEFALINKDENELFSYLQSMNEPSLSFVLVSPFNFFPDYEFELPDMEREELGIEDKVKVYSIVTIHHQVEKSTINLLAPLIFNPVTCNAKQVVLHQSKYTSRHPILTNTSSELLSKEGGD